MQAWLVAKVPRALTPIIRSKRFIGVSSVPVRLMALALLTRMSMPPKCSAARATPSAICASSRISTWSASALPPAASISSAALWMVPGSFGCGFGRLGGDDDVGAVAGGPQRYGLADATAGAGDEQGFAGQIGHGEEFL